MALITDTAALARKDWTYAEISALYREVFPDAALSLGKSILWADTGTTGRDSITNYLRRRGYFMHTADNSLDALLFIREHTPDCCILDVDLAPVSGLEILETLTRDETYRNLAVFIVSDHSDAKINCEKRLIQFFGGVKILKKPLTTPTLLSELGALFKINK